MRRYLLRLLALVFVLSVGLPLVASAQEYPDLTGEELIVYVVFHEREGERLLARFAEHTGVSYSLLRMPTGEAVARVMAEADSPRADVILGGVGDAHEHLALEGLLEPHISPEAEAIPEQYRGNLDGYWTGMYLGPLAILVNLDRWEAEFEPEDLEKPTSFFDLLDPAYQGEIIMPDPLSSGTAYTMVAAMAQLIGEDEAFDFFQELDQNVGLFTRSGFTPAQRAGIGEFLLAINFLHDQLLVAQAGFNIESIVPEDAGWEIGGVSIIAGGPNTEAARAFKDFALSREAGQLHTDLTQRISTRPDVVLPEGVVPLEELPIFLEYDLVRAAEEREALLDRWEREVAR